MSQTAEPRYYTPEEYFAIEERAEYRSEYYEIFTVAWNSLQKTLNC
jgi:hypothetical protein